MNEQELIIIPYTATSLSIIGRFIFMFILYKNKSTNSLSLLFCILSIISSGMWISYSINTNDNPLIFRSSTELSLLTMSAIYIIRNKVITYKNHNNNNIINIVDNKTNNTKDNIIVIIK
jgi:lipid-A-disaccharide synthase-like uncharacterized protein